MNIKNKNYEDSRKVINGIIVELFKNILTIEEKSLKDRGIKDLSITEIHVIEAIGIGNRKMMSEIADILEVTMGTLTIAMTKLEKKGYVVRKRDERDRRIVVCSLTRRGVLAEKIHRNFHDEMIDHLMVDLKLEEEPALIQALKNINAFFIREYGGKNDN